MASNIGNLPLTSMLQSSARALARSVSRLKRTAELLRGSQALLNHPSAPATGRAGTHDRKLTRFRTEKQNKGNGAHWHPIRNDGDASLIRVPFIGALQMNYSYSTAHHPARERELLPLPCEICGKQVSLESANTDGDGKAVHEDCYLNEVAKRKDGRDPS